MVGNATDTWDKIITNYSYINLDIDRPIFSHGLVYHDDQSDWIQWQCGSIVTFWHGKWARSSWSSGGVITLKFDCLAGNREASSARLKATILRTTGNANGRAE